MHCLIYRFRVRPGEQDRFVRSWSEVTRAFINSCGGLGSRLHLNEGQEYIAYAQWPSHEAREAAELPAEIRNGPLAEMGSCCESIETLYELTPIADHLPQGGPQTSASIVSQGIRANRQADRTLPRPPSTPKT